MSRKTQKLYTSRTNSLDANTYVGEAGRLFYDEPTTTHTAPILRYSDGVTVGGVPLFANGDRWPADAVGFLYDDGAGNLSWSSTPTTYSDANVTTLLSGNITTGNIINAGDYYYANGASLTSTIQNFVANVDFGNLYIVDETIYGRNTNQDIYITPAGTTGAVVVPRLKIPVGSIISNSSPISVIVLNTSVESVLTYSTNNTDALPSGTYGIPNGVAAPYTVYKLTSNASPNILQNDHVSGIDLPLGDVVQIGTGFTDGNANVIVVNRSISEQPTPPGSGTTVFATRDIVNSGFTVATLANTDISLAPGIGGSTITTANLLPFVDNATDLGSPTRRFHHLWMGTGTIYVQDETLGSDLAIGARAGNLYVAGGSGLTVGKFTLYGNTIALNNPSEDFYIGSQHATGNLNIRRPLQVLNSSGNVAFQVDRNGKTDFFGAGLTSGQSSVSIIATIGSNEYPVTAPLGGSLIHATAKEGTPGIITVDGFSDSASSGGYFLSRRFRGTVAAPAAVQANDTMLLLGTAGYNGTGIRTGVSSARITFKAAETFNSTSQSAYTEFRNQVKGTGVDAVSAIIDADGLTIPSTAQGGTGGAGVRFADNTFQTTAWVPSNNIQQITVGTGFDPGQQGVRTGNISLDTVDVHSVVSASYSLTVANITPNSQHLRLTLAQEIGTNSSPTFGNVYVGGNLYVAGNVISQGSNALNGKILYLANNSSTSSDIQGGGIQLGANGAAYARTLKYSLTGPHGDYWYTDSDTGFQTEHLNASDAYLSGNLFANGTGYFGGSYNGYTFPNAGLQITENVNSYAQVVEQNLSTGTKATTDFIATANNGTDTTFYVDLGIAGSNYDNTSPTNSLGTSVNANDAYLYVQGDLDADQAVDGGSLILGTATPGKVVKVIAGGVNAADVRVTISNVAINTYNDYVLQDGNDNVLLQIQNDSGIGKLKFTGGSQGIWYNSGIYINGVAHHDSYYGIQALSYNSATGQVTYGQIDAGQILNAYGNANVAAYLPTDANIHAIWANLSTTVSTFTANAAYQEGEIAGLRSNITAANTAIQTISANVGAFELYANANVGTIYTNLNTLTANVGAFELYVNANIGTDRVWLGNLQSNINSINANIGAYETYANVWLGNLQTNIATINNSVTNISGNAALTFVTNAAQNIGNAKNTLLSLFGLANGVALTTNTRYQYEIVFNANCSKAGAMSYALANTATIAQHNYTVQSNKTTTIDGYTAGITMMSFNATGSSITTANPVADTGTFTHTEIYGTIDVVTGGTVNFMVSQDQNTPVTWYILPGAFIRLFPLGPIGANTVIGTWS